MGEEFDAVGPAVADAYEVFPSSGGTEGRGTVAVFNDVVHVFVVAFHTEFYNEGDGVVDGGGYLLCGHGFDAFGGGNPEVGGEADAGSGEEVHVLRHVGVADFDGEVFSEEGTAGDAGLEGGIECVFNAEGAEV